MKQTTLLFILLTTCQLGFAQNKTSNFKETFKVPATVRQFYTQKNNQRLLATDKAYAFRRQQLDFAAANTAGFSFNEAVTLPVVVHIIYNPTNSNKLPFNTGDIKDQLDVVSNSFRQTTAVVKHEADTKEKFSERNGLDSKINFCLAATDTTGKKTSGIVTVPTNITQFSPDDKMKYAKSGGSKAWNTDKYINVWVVNLPDSIGGYAQMPGGNTETDGIVINARYFVQNNDDKMAYNQGKTLIHLFGSYLNLYELWSETTPCGDDGVDDTPVHNAPNIGCPTYQHVSTCDGKSVEMTMNYMASSNDECMYMFTKGQMQRMQMCLLKGGIRRNLAEAGKTQCNINNFAASELRIENNEKVISQVPTITYNIFPSPAGNEINCVIGTEITDGSEIKVYSVTGQQVYSSNSVQDNDVQSYKINCAKWPTGLYLVRLKINKEYVNERLLVTH